MRAVRVVTIAFVWSVLFPAVASSQPTPVDDSFTDLGAWDASYNLHSDGSQLVPGESAGSNLGACGNLRDSLEADWGPKGEFRLDVELGGSAWAVRQITIRALRSDNKVLFARVTAWREARDPADLVQNPVKMRIVAGLVDGGTVTTESSDLNDNDTSDILKLEITDAGVEAKFGAQPGPPTVALAPFGDLTEVRLEFEADPVLASGDVYADNFHAEAP